MTRGLFTTHRTPDDQFIASFIETGCKRPAKGEAKRVTELAAMDAAFEEFKERFAEEEARGE